MCPRVLICRSNAINPDPRVEKITRALVKEGYPVQLLGWDMTGQFPSSDQVAGVPCHRLRVKARFGKGLSNIFHELRWQAALLGWLIRHRDQYDLVHACDFDTVLPALVCKRLFGKKVIYDIFDFYADMLHATPRPVKALIRRVDLLVINRVDGVILADDSRREQIRGSHPRLLEVVYNSPEEMQPSSHAEGQVSSAGGLRIAYVGSLTLDRGLLELLAVLQRHPEWKLDLAGFGGDEQRILSAARQLRNVAWHGRIPNETALQICARADTLIATYSPQTPNNRYSSPNKLFEAMMLSKPIIVARNTNMDRIVAHEDCGLLVEYGNVAELESALQRLQNESLRQRYGVNGREAYERSYAWVKMAERLSKLYKSLSPI